MNRRIIYLLAIVLLICYSCESEPSVTPEPKPKPTDTLTLLPQLKIEGRYLKDMSGEIVNLYGFAQTYSPYFNEHFTQWNDYDVDGCLRYNKNLIDEIVDRIGWKVNWLRLHMDPYWSNIPGCTPPDGEASINCFDVNRFIRYLRLVFIPMAEYAISKGLYVVMRPPGVCPKDIEVGDAYNEYLIRVWSLVAQNEKIKNNHNIMFELANEPVNILGNGVYGNNQQVHFDNLKEYFQPIVDTIRTYTEDKIIWVPGLGYQSLYKGLKNNPIEGENIGYAVHIYPGWLGSDGENLDGGVGSGGGYYAFKKGWDEQIKPVADFAPIMITEMDWAPAKYDASWGKGITGRAGGRGFGANMKRIVDDSGNVSWLIFTWPHLMAKFVNEKPAPGEEYTFLNDPDACVWAAYHWFEEYNEEKK